jgi:hypothetical protein
LGRHGVGQEVVERLAIGQSGEEIMRFEITQPGFGLAPLAAAHPSKRDRRSDARAEQQQGHAGDQAEITGEHSSPLALVEIDEERPVGLAAHVSWNGEHRIMRHGGVRAVVERHGGFCTWEPARSAVHVRIERQSRLAAREAEVAGMVVKLVAEHAVSITELVEDAVQMRSKRRPRERIDQGAWLPVELFADASRRRRGLALELHLADLARRHESGVDDQRAKQHQGRPRPIFLERRQGGHKAAGSVSIRANETRFRRVKNGVSRVLNKSVQQASEAQL